MADQNAVRQIAELLLSLEMQKTPQEQQGRMSNMHGMMVNPWRSAMVRGQMGMQSLFGVEPSPNQIVQDEFAAMRGK